MVDPVTNFGKAQVSTGYGSGDTSIVLTSGGGAKFPTAVSSDNTTFFNLVWFNSTDFPDPSDDPNVEIVRVTNTSVDTLAVVRAQEGTSATTKNTGGKTYKMILAPTRKTILDLQIKRPATYTTTVTHVSGNSDAGVAFTLGTYMKYGDITRFTFRGSYTAGTIYPFSANASSPTTGITPAAASFVYINKTGTIIKTDYVSLDNEIMRVSGTTSTYLTVVRGLKGSNPSFHNHMSVVTKLVNGVRVQIFTDSSKKPQKKIFELTNMMTFAGMTRASINVNGSVIRLSGSPGPRNLFNQDIVFIQDTTNASAVVQFAYGTVVNSTFGNMIYVYGSLASHASNKSVQKLISYELPQSYKGSSNTLYGNLFIDERVPAGGTITFSLGITVDKFGSVALG